MKTNKVRITLGSWSGVIALDRGACLESLRNEDYGVSILREPPANGELDNPYLYGMPILFPANRIENGKFEFEGRIYSFPVNEPATNCHLHGMLHETPFELVEKSDSSVVCRYRAEKGEYLDFPHAFEIIQRYELVTEGLLHIVTVTNLSEDNMPVFLAFHTTFNTKFIKDSFSDNIRAFAEISEEYERNMEVNYLTTGVKLPFDDVSSSLAGGTYNPFQGKISRHYRGKGKMSLTDLDSRLRMVYENDEKYGFRIIYNGGKDGYICLEPQTCLVNCPNSPFSREEGGFDFLKVGESKTYHSKIYIEKI